MTAKILAGIAGTGSTQGDRRRTIPLLEERFGDYQLFTQQGDDGRPGWLLEILQRTWQLPGMVSTGGTFQTYEDMPQVDFQGETLNIPRGTIGIDKELRAAAAVLDRHYGKRSKWKHPLLCGWPMPTIDYAKFTFPTNDGLENKHRQAFAWATLAEIKDTYEALGPGNMVLCLESPASLVAMHLAQNQGHDLDVVAMSIAEEFANFIKLLPKKLQVAVHLCRGDLNHKSWFRGIDSLAPLVILTNAIVQHFPKEHRLAGIFMPTCAGDMVPSLNEDFYGPLSYLKAGTPVILGNIHEMVSREPGITLEAATEHNLMAFEMAVSALRRGRDRQNELPIAGSFSCGGLRMTPDQYAFGVEVQSQMLAIAGVHS